MKEISIKKLNILNNILNEVEYLKNEDNLNEEFSFDILPAQDEFEKHNDKVFYINMYILTRLFKDEYEMFIKERKQLTLEEYYNFIESLNLPDSIYELYMKMPKMINRNKILSYTTDIPSFMGIIKD